LAGEGEGSWRSTRDVAVDRRNAILAQSRDHGARYNRAMPKSAPLALLGGITPAAFLRRHWQKRALLVHRALPDFRGCLTVPQLLALAARDDVESRIVLRERGRWSTLAGPIARSTFKGLPEQGWTLLVHGVNLHVSAGDALLRRFAFIPYARLDDLMVSYAVPGGGVGAHFDSYDVFLLQGEGRRRWRVSRQRDLALRRGMPLKILARFRPTERWLLDPGDMLYLPPDHAHEGVAVDTCTTYSIGFRAPAAQELGTAFLDWLRDNVALDGRYADPDLTPTNEPARIGARMQSECAAMLAAIRWDPATVARFVGSYLTEPKPDVVFDRPRQPLTLRRFARIAQRRGLRLDPRTQILYDGRHMYVNGASVAWPRGAHAILQGLANLRRVAGSDLNSAALLRILHEWYGDGFLDFD
jgi:50S ribosomal protein L16 3-hydroxylase